jgi:DNA-binding IclR family transcriptional regulator
MSGPMVKSADRSLQILEFISLAKEGMSHKDLSRALGIPGSSLSALLSTLVSREYLNFDSISRRYRIGPEILYLAGRYLANFDIVRMGSPILRALVTSTSESALIAIRNQNNIQVVSKELCSESIQQVIDVGERAPLYATAAGKAILAYFNDEELKNYFDSVKLKPLTSKTITNKKILTRQLKQIRSGAIAYSLRENDEHIIAMAAPIFDLHRTVAASITVPVPVVRFSSEKEKIIEPALRAAAESLSHQLGFQGS